MWAVYDLLCAVWVMFRFSSPYGLLPVSEEKGRKEKGRISIITINCIETKNKAKQRTGQDREADYF